MARTSNSLLPIRAGLSTDLLPTRRRFSHTTVALRHNCLLAYPLPWVKKVIVFDHAADPAPGRTTQSRSKATHLIEGIGTVQTHRTLARLAWGSRLTREAVLQRVTTGGAAVVLLTLLAAGLVQHAVRSVGAATVHHGTTSPR